MIIVKQYASRLSHRSRLCLCARQSTYLQFLGVNGHTLSAVVCLVYAHQTICQLKHVVTQTDNDELSILCTLLKVK